MVDGRIAGQHQPSAARQRNVATLCRAGAYYKWGMLMRRGSRFFVLALSGIAAIASPVLGQTTKRTELRALRVSIPPKLDGILDDEAWTGPALPLDTWFSYNPINGEPAAQRTSVWIAYDEHAFYFAFKCFDTEPEKIRTTISRRDTAWNDDWIAISLDSS